MCLLIIYLIWAKTASFINSLKLFLCLRSRLFCQRKVVTGLVGKWDRVYSFLMQNECPHKDRNTWLWFSFSKKRLGLGLCQWRGPHRDGVCVCVCDVWRVCLKNKHNEPHLKLDLLYVKSGGKIMRKHKYSLTILRKSLFTTKELPYPSHTHDAEVCLTQRWMNLTLIMCVSLVFHLRASWKELWKDETGVFSTEM